MNKIRILSATMALCLGVSAVPAVHVGPQQKLLAAEVSSTNQTARAVDPSSFTYDDVYNAMIALKDDPKYLEGTPWTDFTPYSSAKGVYKWHGGAIRGVTGGVGCAAFAFILSDTAFGNLPARILDRGQFSFEDVRPGDIMRVNNNKHFVIVLQKSAGGVILAEGNYNKSVHWGRVMSAEEVNRDTTFIITRYPEGYVSKDDPEADTVVDNGITGSLNWSLTKAGTLTISGAGSIPNYSPNDDILPPWKDSYISTIVIEEGVTGVGNYAFYGSKALSVYIPDSVKSIGQSAFYESKILSVTIPSAVTAIGNDAFSYCSNLASVTVSEGVKVIGERTFKGCDSLKYIDFPATITEVGAGAFTSCGITRVRFKPSTGKVTMGDNLFTQCWYLTDVTLPQKADRISAGMFQSCSSLSKLYIPAGVSEIGDKAFTQCYGLQKDGIYFEGSEATWNGIGGKSALITLQPYTVPMHYNETFNNPFIPEPEAHSWLEDWVHSTTHHWHECELIGCSITENENKDGYGEHDFVKNADGTKHTCTVCGYSEATSSPTIVPNTQVSLAKDTLVYGEDLASLTFNAPDFVVEGINSKVEGILAFREPNAVPEVGTVEAEWEFIPKDHNYDSVLGTVSITVEPKPITISNKDYITKHVYTGEPLSNPTAEQFTTSVGDFNPAFNFSWYSQDGSSLQGAPLSVGEYVLKVTATASENKNYSEGVLEVPVSINPKEIIPLDHTLYFTEGHTAEYTFDVSDLILGVEGRTEYSIASVSENSIIEGTPILAGSILTIPVKAVASEDQTATIKISFSNPNYTIANVAITLIPTDKDVVKLNGITVPETMVYNGEKFVCNGIPLWTTEDGEEVAINSTQVLYESIDGAGYSSSEASVNAGSYEVTFSVGGADSKYVGTESFAFIIAKKTVNVAVKDKIISVGDFIPNLTSFEEGTDYSIKGLVSNDSATSTLTFIYANNDGEEVTPDNTVAGTYLIVASGLENPNYDFVYTAGKLTIEAKPSNDDDDDGNNTDDPNNGKNPDNGNGDNNNSDPNDRPDNSNPDPDDSNGDNNTNDPNPDDGSNDNDSDDGSNDGNDSNLGDNDNSSPGNSSNLGNNGSSSNSGGNSSSGSSSSGGSTSSNGGSNSITQPTNSDTTSPVNNTPLIDVNTTPSATTPSTTETKPDGTVVKTEEQVVPDGTKTETVTETRTDGTKMETVTKTTTDGTVLEECVTETAADGSAIATTKTTTTNSSGTEVSKVIVKTIAASGSITKTTEESTFSADNAETVVTTVKDSNGRVTEALASVSQQGEITATGKTKLTISSTLADQITEAAGTDDVDITVSVTDDADKQLYSLTVNKKKLTSGNSLYLYGYDAETDTYTMVNAVEYKMTNEQGLTIKASAGQNYTLLDQAEMADVSKQIMKTVKLSTAQKTKKSGKSFKVVLSKKANTASIKKITYTTSNKKIATVTKSGQVKTKAKGTAKVKAKVTMKNGKTKTLVLKVKVKK